jgi:D-arabinose 1-dehydrogenase-like Zn-dependent alcohol dehydrogenase
VARSGGSLSRAMMAARLHAPGSPLLIEEVPVPTPSPGEVLVRVLAAGVCGSDRHMFRGQLPVANTPIVLGHEIAGTVEAIGPGVQGVEPGQAVMSGRASLAADAELVRPAMTTSALNRRSWA